MQRNSALSALLPLVCVVTMTLPHAASAQVQVGPHIQVQIDLMLERLDRACADPVALVAIEQLDRLSRWFPYHATLAEPLTTISERDDCDPLVRSALRWRIAAAERSVGDLAASEALVAAEGYISAWSIIGPFPNDGMSGFDFAYPPELERDPQATYEGRSQEVQWRDASELTRLGVLELSQLTQPSQSAISYALTTVDVPTARSARLWTSVDGAYRLWLNGQVVGEMERDLGGGALREWWDINLEAGSNVLLVKLATDDGPMGLTMRLSDTTGAALFGATLSAEFTADPSPMSSGRVTGPSGSVLAELTSRLLDSPVVPKPELLAGAALVIQSYYLRDPQEPWNAFLDNHAVCESQSVVALRHCALIEGHYWQRHRALTMAASWADPDSTMYPWVLFDLAESTLSAIGDSAVVLSRQLTEQILDSHPDFVPALLLLARIYSFEGLPWRASSLVREVLDAYPMNIEAQYEARVDGPNRLALLERGTEIMADDPSQFAALAPVLAEAGQLEAATEVLERGRSLHPTEFLLFWIGADYAINSGDLEDAERIMLEATERFPGNPSGWERLGRVYVRAGDYDRAAEAFEHALALEPQNQAISLYLGEIQSSHVPFYANYELSLDDINALAVANPTDDADRDYVTLVDQTVVRIHENGLGTRFVQQAYQIQTRHGADALREMWVQYTPGDEVVDILTVRVIKADGRVLESFNRWEESLSQPWYGLYYDYRAYIIGFDELEAGDILEWSYTLAQVSQRNIFDDYFGDLWFIQDGQPKRLARYAVIHPATMSLHFREPSTPFTANVYEDDFGQHEVYEFRDVPRVEYESRMPGGTSSTDYIHVSTFATWDEVSRWYWNLIDDQLITSPEMEATVAELIEGLDSLEDRVAAIHEYVVRNTRYVGLEFGIHGFRPYRTTAIFDRRFGDCKDTASLMTVMMSIAEIEAHVVLIRTRDLGTLDPEPASLAVFNHAIAYVPELDLFLDGTAGHSGMHELPSNDQGATTLVVLDGEGHHFLQTAFAPAEDNTLEYHLTVDLNGDDSPTVGTAMATGQFAPSLRYRYEGTENPRETFEREIGNLYPGAVINDLSFTGLDDIRRPVEVTFNFSDTDWLQGPDELPFMFVLGSESELSAQLAATATRRQPLDLGYPYRLRETIRYQLPADLRYLDGPRSVSERSPFGSLELTVREEGTDLVVEMILTVTQSIIAVEEYPAFREFVQNVEAHLDEVLTFEREGGQ